MRCQFSSDMRYATSGCGVFISSTIYTTTSLYCAPNVGCTARCGAGAQFEVAAKNPLVVALVVAVAGEPTVCACAGGDVTDVGKKRPTKKNRQRRWRKTCLSGGGSWRGGNSW